MPWNESVRNGLDHAPARPSPPSRRSPRLRRGRQLFRIARRSAVSYSCLPPSAVGSSGRATARHSPQFAHFSGEPNAPLAAYLVDGCSLVMDGDWDVIGSSVTTVVMGDAEMAAEFAAGSADAVRAVYQAYGRLVYSVAFKVLGDATLAEDATQQAFLQAWRAAPSYDPARALGPWLATIARRTAIDVYRHTRRHEAHNGLESAEATLVSHPPSLDQLYEIWEVRRAIDSLPAEDQEVIRLQHYAG